MNIFVQILSNGMYFFYISSAKLKLIKLLLSNIL